MTERPPVLEVRDLKRYFNVAAGLGALKAIDGVSFDLMQGETLGLVGESGCGKSTLGRTILRAYEPTGGSVHFHLDGESIDITRAGRKELRGLRRHMQMIFQDPQSSLDPRMTVFDIIAEPLRLNKLARGKELEERVGRLMDDVGLPRSHMKRYPHAFSGGQRQRIGIARALASSPKVIVCDEAVSALDVSIQAQILNLLKDLQARYGLSYLFIAHDLGVVEYICDRVAVMYVGRLVELASTDDIYTRPLHPYTEALMSAVPAPDPDQKRSRIVLSGEVANAAALPSGCPFHPRCAYAEARCRTDVPALREVLPGRTVACHRAEELLLAGTAAH
ncbi:MAG TPA: oligopeptide/dipeptide ABC transporter ATP-binding protein [Devosiaceae bacterium]|jgi:peptide/nickel transport system ATP-binding protein